MHGCRPRTAQPPPSWSCDPLHLSLARPAVLSTRARLPRRADAPHPSVAAAEKVVEEWAVALSGASAVAIDLQ